MPVFKTLEEFKLNRGIYKNFDDYFMSKKIEKKMKIEEALLNKYPDVLSVIPKQKLKKVVKAKYVIERLRGIERDVGDVKRLRESAGLDD